MLFSALLLAGLAAFAEVPSVCNDSYLWLDASKPETLVTNDQGQVTEWKSALGTGGRSATAYTLSAQSPSGPTIVNSLVSFGDTAANRDLHFAKSTNVRAVFMVAKVEQSGNAFLLGDDGTYDFHRGGSGEYWHGGHSSASIRNGKTYFNGIEVTNPTSATMPNRLALIDVQTAGNVTASQLCYDRAGNGATPRRGGKDIAELMIFERALSPEEQQQVRDYLMAKWGVWEQGDAKVVRAHPRLTIGLERESLIGIKLTDGQSGALTNLTVRFDLTNCTPEQVRDVRVWRQKYDPVPFTFFERDAIELKLKGVRSEELGVRNDGIVTVNFVATNITSDLTIYPKSGSMAEGDYVWVTAKIDESIATNAEIWASIEGDRVRLASGDFKLSNQQAKAPHRPFPYKYQIGAYVRQDRLVDNGQTTWDIFSGNPKERFETLTDVLPIYSAKDGYSNGKFYISNWDKNLNDTASTARLVKLRDQYNPGCMIRPSLTPSTWVSANGIYGLAFEVAGAAESTRKQFAEEIVSFLVKQHCDGLDIDYEWVRDGTNHREWQNIGKMLRELSEQFFDHGFVLSFAGRSHDSAQSGMPYSEEDYGAFNVSDYMMMQSYGGGWLNSAPCIQRRTLDVCTKRLLPLRRVVMGQAAYVSADGHPGWDGASYKIEAFTSDPLRRFDIDTWWKVPYSSYWPFEGMSSLQAQCLWARRKELGGVMSWGYYTDPTWEGWSSFGRHQSKAIWPMSNCWKTPEKIGEVYQMKTEEDWFWLAEHPDVRAKLANDITLTHDPLVIDTWTGELDGDGHTLTFAKDTWVASEKATGLIRMLKGTVKNLTVEMNGRVFTVAARWNDQTANPADTRLVNTMQGENPVGVIAAEAGDGAIVENVMVSMGAGSEVKGVKYAGGLVGKVSGGATITNNTVQVGGKLHLEVRNIWDTLFQPSSPAIDGAVGYVAKDAGATIADNTVTVEEGGEVQDLDYIPEPQYEIAGDWCGPTGFDWALPWDLDVRSSDYAVEVVMELPNYTEGKIPAGHYPQLVNMTGAGKSISLSASGDGGGELFLTGNGSTATYAYPISRTALRGNGDVGSGAQLAPTNHVVTIVVENRAGELRIIQNGETVLVTDKNVASDGYVRSVQIGGGIAELGGGRIVSVRLKLGRKSPLVHPEGYGKLVFDEEFDGDTIDWDRHWEKVPDNARHMDWKKYTSPREDLYAVSNGCLVLTGAKNDGKDPNDTRKYQCGQIQSNRKFSFKYGIVEIRAKFTDQDGAWPAIWMMPQNAVHGGWPRSGEIDISERLNADKYTYQTAHFGDGKDTTSGATGPIDKDNFNVFRLEWTEDAITWSINGVKTHSYANPGGDWRTWPFDSDFYFILSQQLEGSWVGKVDDETTLPNRMFIDYVRVWQKDETDAKQNAYLWLDASAGDTVVTNDVGEVQTWYSANLCGKTAQCYSLASDSPTGPMVEDGLVSFGDTTDNRDLCFDRATDLRTVFMVAKVRQGGNAFLLGDSSKYDFHRGSNGEYWNATYANAGIRNGRTLWNGERVESPTAVTMPGEFGLIEVHATNGVAASQLCYDRAGNGSTARRGGKDIAELIAFREELGEITSADIRRYLMTKWSVGSMATWTFTESGLEKTGSETPALLWVMNHAVDTDATVSNDVSLANLNTANISLAEKPVTLDFTNQIATIVAGPDTRLAQTNAADLVIASGMKATLLEGVTMGRYELDAGGTLRNTGDFSSGKSVDSAFVAGSAGTYEFKNILFTGGLQSNYKVRVTDGDNIAISGDSLNGRCKFAFDVQGGKVTFPAVASTWVENATYRQSGGEFVSFATSKNQSGTGDGLMLGFNGISMSLDITGGLFTVPNSSLNFFDSLTMNIGGTGVVRAKGIFRSSDKPATVNVTSGGILEVGSLGMKASTCALNLKGGTLKGYEANAEVHDNVNFLSPSVLASSEGASLKFSGNLYGSSTVTFKGGSTLILPSSGELTFALVTDCAGVKVTNGVLDFGTTRGAELSALSGTGTIRITLTDAERKTAKDGIRLFKWSGGNYAGNITVVPNVGGAAGLVLKDGYLTFTPAIVALSATVSSVTNWCDIVWTDNLGHRAVGSEVVTCATKLTATDGAVIRVCPTDDVNVISMALTGRVTVLGENLTYLPWSGMEVGGTVVYDGTYDLGEGIASFSASGTYEFAPDCTITANKFMTGNTYDVVQTFTQYGNVVVTNNGAGTATGTAPAIFAHWGSGRPSTVTYNLTSGDFIATNSTRYALYFGADGKPTLNIGGGEAAARMRLSGLAQGTDGTTRTQSGAINIKPSGTLEIGSGGIYLRNANTTFNLVGGKLKFTANCSVAINNANRVHLTADSTVEVAPGKNVTFAHPWTGDGKLMLTGGGSISMSIDIPSKNVHDGIAVDIAKVANDFPASKCHIYFTCEEYEGIREAAKLEVVSGVLKATPQVDTSVWVQTDITGNNGGQVTVFQTQSSFYRGKSEFQPLICLRVDKLPQNKVLRSISAALSDGTVASAITDVKLYRTSMPYFANAEEIYKSTMSKTIPTETNRRIGVDYWNPSHTQANLPTIAVGDYLWLCVRVAADAPAHGELDARITSWVSDGMYGNVYNVDPKGAGEVYPYEYHVVPYWRVSNWTMNALTRQHFACYTEIIPFHIIVNANGSVSHGWNDEQFTDEKFQAAIDRMKSLRAGKDVKLLVGVGASQGSLPTVCANATIRKEAAKNLAAFVKKFGLDGVDFDWEYPTTKAHWEGWCNLVADLKPLLFREGGGKLVSVAVTGWSTQQAGTDLGAGDAVKGLYQQCDFVNMMSYDGKEAAGHATLALMDSDFTRAATYGGIPNYKICGGQAFYTNHYPCDDSQNGFNWVVNNYPQYVDSVDKFTGTDGKVYTYNSLATIRTKCARCRELGGGSMIWANETDVALSHAKSATRAMFSQIYPSRGSATDGTLEVTEASDWPAIVSVGTATLGADITLDADVLRPAVFKGTLDGKGHTITVNDPAPLITSNSGKLKNLTARYTDGVDIIYDADGNAVRGCAYPNVVEGEGEQKGAITVDIANDALYATAGAMMNLKTSYTGNLIAFRVGAYDIWVESVPTSGHLKLRLGYTDGSGRHTGYGSDVLVTPGAHAISLNCGSWTGTALYVDGVKVTSSSSLVFSKQKFTKATIGGEGLGLYAYDVLPGYMGAFVYPYLASYPAFNAIAIHEDDDPLELTDLATYASNAVATVFASIASPAFETAKPVLDMTVKQKGDTLLVEAYREGEARTRLGWRHLNSDARTFAEQNVTSRETIGNRVWHLSYDATGGSYLDVNGKSAAASEKTKWGGSQLNGIALGLTAGSIVNERQWLVGQAIAADPEKPLGDLVTPPDWYGSIDSAAQDYLYATLGTEIEGYEIPEITVNGEEATTNEALLAMRYFAGEPTESRDYTLALDAPVVGADSVTLGLLGDQPVNAALQLRLTENLTNNDWRVAAELPAGSPERSFSFPRDIGGNFYRLRASESVSSKARNDMPIVSNARTQVSLGAVSVGGTDEIIVQLGGAGVAEGLTGYLAIDGVAYVARADADGTLVFDVSSAEGTDSSQTAELTLIVPKGAGNGDIHIAGSATRALVTEVVADNLYKDGFTTYNFGSYRIPALVTDGKGEVLCCYDVRYGGGDLGTGDGIDIGETYSADGGNSFEKPRLAVDVLNKRERDGSQRSGWNKNWDIGDVALLFDPKTETYWMMGMTGTGLYRGNYSMNDVVMYTRGKGKDAAWTPWKNPQSNSTDPLEYRSIKETIMSQPGIRNASGGNGYGFLDGPGHGFVTLKDVVYTNGNVECTMPKGTLVFPTQYFVDSSLTKTTVGAVYSTDHGTNWIATARTTQGDGPQENCVMELDDGSWYMTTKAGSRQGTGRINFFRTTNYTNWVYVGEYNPVPCQQGSCLRLGKGSDGKGRYVLCHTLHPNAGTRARLALVLGTDTTGEIGDTAGVSWDFSNPLMLYYDDTGFKGYNSLCLIDENTLGVLYEAQGHIYFIRIDIRSILSPSQASP